jgi:hypothetical protein
MAGMAATYTDLLSTVPLMQHALPTANHKVLCNSLNPFRAVSNGVVCFLLPILVSIYAKVLNRRCQRLSSLLGTA